MFKLLDLLPYDNITIQCHNNPDADTIACGYSLYEFFKYHKKQCKLVYGGKIPITKPNLLQMISILNIPIELVSDIPDTSLLITVDSQYGAGNIHKFNSPKVAIIDHHIQEVFDVELCHIESYLGSCSTIIWKMLIESNFPLEEYEDINTALYYGLYTDTNGFSETYHPLDNDMKESLKFDESIIIKLKNSNLSLQDLETAGVALLRCSYNQIDKFAIFKSHPCDQNILGFISDLAIQVDSISVCIVYNELQDGIKFSIRSCIPEVKASELASFISYKIGSGGGHLNKAGGFISFKEYYKEYNTINLDAYFLNKIREYYDSYDIIYANKYVADSTKMKSYIKKKLPIAYVESTKIFSPGTPIIIRTLEGDLNTITSENIYIMIGIKGEVYPISKAKFENSYTTSDEKPNINGEYKPTVKNKFTGESIALENIAFTCTPKSSVSIYTIPLTKNTKVFTAWDNINYMSGKPGDYLAVRQDDLHDVYIIEKNIFDKTYELNSN